MQRTISIIITGKVQGVFFRQSAREKAHELGLTGQAKNLENGHVHIIVTGSGEQLAIFSDWCKTGPPRAIVTDVEITELPLILYKDFTIIRH